MFLKLETKFLEYLEPNCKGALKIPPEVLYESPCYQEVEARHYWKHDYRIVTEVIIIDAIAEDEEFLADIFGNYYVPRINLPGFGSRVATFDRF